MSIIAAAVVAVLCIVQTSGVSAQPAGEPPPQTPSAVSPDPPNVTPAPGAPATDGPGAEPAATPPAAGAEPAPETVPAAAFLDGLAALGLDRAAIAVLSYRVTQ